MKRWLAILIALCAVLSGCGKSDGADDAIKEFSFSDSINISAIKKLDGQRVRINGYMATLSPVNGKYMYLMNMPYQSCPFCVPNTTQLANTIAVYAKEGKAFEYTDQAIRVTGTMRVEDYADEFSYEYNYRIVDASYEVIDLATVSAEYALWYSIASDGLVSDIGAMFDFVHFVCQWTEYQSYTINEDGSRTDWYLYPGDTQRILVDTGPYGYASQMADDYFPGLIRRADAISKTDMEDVKRLISDARQLTLDALNELNANRFTYDEQADKYSLNADANLYQRYQNLYLAFSEWLAKWEL